MPVGVGAHSDYFCENEGAFVRYRKVGDYWEARLPNGSRLVFGKSLSARVVDPQNAGKVFRWMLECQVDTSGNEIRYRYSDYQGEANLAQKYLVSISYGPGEFPWGKGFNSIVLDYEDRGGGWFEDCRPGFVLRAGRRLTRVVSCSQGVEIPFHQKGDFNHDGEVDYLNRIYRIEYHDNVPVSLVACRSKKVIWMGMSDDFQGFTQIQSVDGFTVPSLGLYARGVAESAAAGFD